MNILSLFIHLYVVLNLYCFSYNFSGVKLLRKYLLLCFIEEEKNERFKNNTGDKCK